MFSWHGLFTVYPLSATFLTWKNFLQRRNPFQSLNEDHAPEIIRTLPASIFCRNRILYLSPDPLLLTRHCPGCWNCHPVAVPSFSVPAHPCPRFCLITAQMNFPDFFRIASTRNRRFSPARETKKCPRSARGYACAKRTYRFIFVSPVLLRFPSYPRSPKYPSLADYWQSPAARHYGQPQSHPVTDRFSECESEF